MVSGVGGVGGVSSVRSAGGFSISCKLLTSLRDCSKVMKIESLAHVKHILCFVMLYCHAKITNEKRLKALAFGGYTLTF